MSKSGVQVVPEFAVFQTPPEPTATYQVLGSRGSIAMSAMRPDMKAGPMPRSFRPSKAFLGFSALLAATFAGGSTGAPTAGAGPWSQSAAAQHTESRRSMGLPASRPLDAPAQRSAHGDSISCGWEELFP